MNKKYLIIGGVGLSLLAAGIYGKKVFDAVNNDIFYNYDVNTIRVLSLNPSNFKISVDFIIENRGDLEVNCKDLKIDVIAFDRVISKIDRSGDFRILPKQKVPVNIVISADIKYILQNREDFNLSNWKDIPLTFKGSLKVKKLIWLPIPFKFTYKIKDFV